MFNFLKKKNNKNKEEKPYAMVKSIIYDESKGIQIDLDWNDAFIKFLRDNGYIGIDDNSIIQKYLLTLTADISQKMNEDQISEFD